MITLSLLLLIVATIFALLAMLGISLGPRFNLIGAALFFYFLSVMFANRTIRGL